MFHAEKFDLAFRQLIDSDLDEALLQISRYHFQNPGLFIRPQLAYNCATAFKLSKQEALICAVIVECLHNASIIHDDIQDNGDIRRDQPSLVKKFGLARALIFGDYLISKAYQLCADLPTNHIQQALKLVHHHVNQTINGQMQDIDAKNHKKIDIEGYQTVCWLKSGQLMMLAVHLPILLCAYQQDYGLFEPIVTHLVTCFQLLDDLNDFEEDKKQNNFSIFNVYDNDQPITTNHAYNLVTHKLKESKEALLHLPADIRFPFFYFLEQIDSKFTKEYL